MTARTVAGVRETWWRTTSPKPVAAGSVAVAGLGLAAWVLASQLIFVIPPPGQTLAAVWENLGSGRYHEHIRATMFNAFSGWVLGMALGSVIGVALGLSRRARLMLQPIVLGGYAVPKIVLYPLVIPFLSIGNPSKVFMAVIMSAFPIMVIVTGATAAMPPIYRLLARSLEASRWQLLTKIVLPAIRRALVTGMRVGASLAILGVILAEFFVSRRGLGQVIEVSYKTGRYVDLFATMFLLFVFTFVVSFVLWRLEKRLD
jgi:NitT/TauT family transport system permease protein